MKIAKPLSLRLYYEPSLYEAARIIGYAGCSPFEFFDAAKKLPCYNEAAFRNAVYDLTRTDRREASPPRYEFTEPARKLMFQLLGPPPEHPLHSKLNDGPSLPNAGDTPPEKPAEPQPKRKKRTRKK